MEHPDNCADAPILIFDSGVGGLSVLAAIRARLPTARFVYAMDNAGYPYGNRDEAEIAARVPALLGRLVERYRPCIAVIACNTASTIALDAVRAALAVPVVGTVPAIKPAAAQSTSRVIGVLGTLATVRQGYVDRLTARFASDCVVLRHGAPALVDFAEGRLRGRAASVDIPAKALAGLLNQRHGERMDIVVLACTHFPLVKDALKAAAPRQLTFVDGADGIARRVTDLLRNKSWPTTESPGLTLATRYTESEQALSAALAGFGLKPPVALCDRQGS